MKFCVEALESTKISSYEQVSSQRYENGYRTKFVTLQYSNHLSTFRHEKHRNSTELSKYVWGLKDRQQEFTIKWNILRRAQPYTVGAKRCNLCLEEKMFISSANKKTLLSKRTELLSTCRHRRTFLLSQLSPGTLTEVHTTRIISLPIRTVQIHLTTKHN